MAQLNSLILLGAIYFIASIFGTLTLFNLIVRFFKIGRTKLFKKCHRTRPDLLDDPSLGTHGFINLDEVRLHYVENGSRDKPLMLFLHGFPEFWYSWRYQLPEFSKDYRAVAVDMRGYSESDKPPGASSYVLDKLIGDIKQLVNALGHEKCILVAHDWGGNIAWMVALAYPEIVEKLIVLNIPHPSAFMKYLNSSWKQFMMSWYIFFFQLPWLPELAIRVGDYSALRQMFLGKRGGAKKGFTKEDIEAFKYTFSLPGCLTSSINYYRAILRYKRNKLKSKTVEQPTLIIWGTNDAALHKDMAQMSVQYCKDVKLHYVEGASHWVQQEEPEAVNQLIREFLNSTKTK